MMTPSLVNVSSSWTMTMMTDDDDDATKPPAIEEQVTKQPSKNPPLIDLTSNGGTKPKAKVQRTFSDLL